MGMQTDISLGGCECEVLSYIASNKCSVNINSFLSSLVYICLIYACYNPGVILRLGKMSCFLLLYKVDYDERDYHLRVLELLR